MSDKKNVNIKIGSDVKEAKSGIQTVTEGLNKLSKNKALTSMSRLGSAVSGVNAAFSIASKTFQAVNSVIEDLNDAYETQAKAENQLAIAAKNNPYLDDYTVQKLKDYASELQNMSEIGDEKLLPVMTELVASGRTYTEIQEIMSAAVDASAGGMISMESAAQALNSSYNGSIGQLGKLLPELKNLTEEELKSGKAIEIVKTAYDGMSSSSATTGTQLANAFGDLKEKIGGLLHNVIEPLKKGLLLTVTAANILWDKIHDLLWVYGEPEATTLDSRLLKAQSELQALQDELDKVKSKYKEAEQSTTGNVSKIAKAEEDLRIAREKGNKVAIAQLETMLKLAKQSAAENTLNTATVKAAEKAKKAREAETEALEKQIQAKNDEIKAIQKEIDANKTEEQRKKNIEETTAAIEKNKKKLDEQIAAIEQKYDLMRSEGQQVDELAEKQEILAAKESAYLELLKTDAKDQATLAAAAASRLSGIKGDYEEVIDAIQRKAEAEKDQKALEKLQQETEKLTDEAKQFIEEFDETKLSARIGATILKLMEMKESLADDSQEAEVLRAKIEELSTLLSEVQEKEAETSAADSIQEWASVYEAKIQIVSNFAAKYYDIMSGISDLVTEQAENEATVKQAALEKQLAAGEISEEEYAEKKEQIEKEAAEKQYKIQMWEWAANLMNIQAQTALAIVSTLAQEQGPAALKIAMSSMIGALGAVQLANAIAAKPVPPSYATGGVVGGFSGASMGGDNTYIHARTGEMILNAKQQRAMFEQLNGGARTSGISNNVSVKNYAAGSASVTTQSKNDGIEFIIRETVRKQLSSGDYDSQLKGAQASLDGIRFV